MVFTCRSCRSSLALVTLVITEDPKHHSAKGQNETVAYMFTDPWNSKQSQRMELCTMEVALCLDHVAGALVLLHSVLLMFQLEMEGRQIAFQLGVDQERQNFDGVLPIFQVLDSMFVFIFLTELLIRIIHERSRFVKDTLSGQGF